MKSSKHRGHTAGHAHTKENINNHVGLNHSNNQARPSSGKPQTTRTPGYPMGSKAVNSNANHELRYTQPQNNGPRPVSSGVVS